MGIFFPCPCHLTCCVLAGCPCSLWPQRQFHFICVLHLQFSQHFGLIHRYLTIITLGLTLNYIKDSLHLVYKSPLHCWNNISGPQCKWKSSPHFCTFLQSAMFFLLHKIKQNSYDKKRDSSPPLAKNALRTGATKVLLLLTKQNLEPFTRYNRASLKN